MDLQVLVATMNQSDFRKLDTMNIRTDCILANQYDRVKYDEKLFKYGTAKMITTNTRGVGINRNIALMYSEAKYLLLADDDIRYYDNYEEIIMEAFRDIPDADAIVFNVESSLGGLGGTRVNQRIEKLKFYKMNYGALRIAFKRSSILKANIAFNINFGGGSIYSAGEDSLFISSMLKNGLKIYTYPKTIGLVDDDSSKSTWFKGYNKKYYYDRGAFFKAFSGNFSLILCFMDLLRHRYYKNYGISFYEAFSLMIKGSKGYNTLTIYNED